MPSFLINASAARSTETSAKLSTPQRGQSTGNLTMGCFMVVPRNCCLFVQRDRNPHLRLGRVLVNECHLFGADVPYSRYRPTREPSKHARHVTIESHGFNDPVLPVYTTTRARHRACHASQVSVHR